MQRSSFTGSRASAGRHRRRAKKYWLRVICFWPSPPRRLLLRRMPARHIRLPLRRERPYPTSRQGLQQGVASWCWEGWGQITGANSAAASCFFSLGGVMHCGHAPTVAIGVEGTQRREPDARTPSYIYCITSG
eukprot:363049-Chlamydomonas_euryale.AAC.20